MTKFVLLVVGLGLILILGVYFLSPRSSGTAKTAGMKTTEAVYQLDRTSVDFGSIAVNDTKSADFSFKNTGSDPIQLSHFQTSCDCTSALIKLGEITSPEIGMAGMMSSSAANWQNELPSGQTATITVTYTPAKMPVYGAVERTTKFMANNKELTLTVKTNVQ
jgi:hypothetical protein